MLDHVYTCFVHVKFLRSNDFKLFVCFKSFQEKNRFIAFQPTCLFRTLEYIVRLKQILNNVQNTVDKKFIQIWFHPFEDQRFDMIKWTFCYLADFYEILEGIFFLLLFSNFHQNYVVDLQCSLRMRSRGLYEKICVSYLFI